MNVRTAATRPMISRVITVKMWSRRFISLPFTPRVREGFSVGVFEGKGAVLAVFVFVGVATLLPAVAVMAAFAVLAVSGLGVPRGTIRKLRASAGSSLRAVARPTFVMGIMALTFLLVASTAVRAEPNGVTALTNSNVNQLAGIEIDVTASHDGSGNLLLSVQLVTNPLTNTPLGIDQFFYGASNVATSVSDPGCSGGSWDPSHLNYDGGTADGFGMFVSLKSDCPAGDGGITAPFTFHINGDPSIAANDHGAHYAIHIRFSGDCSGFVSDGTPSATGDDNGCIPSVIPSVTDIALPAVGLATLVWFVGRRAGKKDSE